MAALDVGYNPAIDYYGYFDSYKVYRYDGTNNRFEPVRVTTNKKVNPLATDEWSGDFLNYLAMARIDALRKVLYGGYRSCGHGHGNRPHEVLHPSGCPCLGQGIRKHYKRRLRHHGNIHPWTFPTHGTRHLFANVTLEDGATDLPDLDRPLLRVLNDSYYRIWEWVSIERPVAGTRCLDGGSGPNCARAAVIGGLHPGHPGNAQSFPGSD
ncbi:MAG: hypothetical protein MZU95_06490 [Desulfomicrobium escambiense]|nr:hypothetical protein [Desulfomicrobium escambiense]